LPGLFLRGSDFDRSPSFLVHVPRSHAMIGLMIVVLKICLGALLTLGCAMVSRFLHIRPLLPSALMAWGCVCFLFSGELSGAKRRIRNGIEEKPPLRIMWMIAGILCVLMAVARLFTEM
jgi:hypothetical protein